LDRETNAEKGCESGSRNYQPFPTKKEMVNTTRTRIAIFGHCEVNRPFSEQGQGATSWLAFASTRFSPEVVLIPPAGLLEESKKPNKVTD
jgi:hypothetical protein